MITKIYVCNSLKISLDSIKRFFNLYHFSRVPRNQGLTSFATKSDLFGSPNSTEAFLNNATLALIIAYYLIAVQLNAINVTS